MNKYRNILLIIFSTMLIESAFTAPASASLNSKTMPSGQPAHTLPAKQNRPHLEDKDSQTERSKAAYKLGMRYLAGGGVQKDSEHAIRLFKRAAMSGYADAQLMLGLIHQAGVDVPADSRLARAWLMAAANQGSSKAQMCLGLMYVNGRGVKKDYEQALYWFRKAAQHQNPEAEFFLGLMYARNLGVPRDSGLAKLWLRKAAQHGSTRAQHSLETIEQTITDEIPSKASVTSLLSKRDDSQQ